MKTIILGIFIIGALASAESSRVSVKFDRGQTGNECYNHPHGDLILYKGDCTKYWQCEYLDGTMVQCPSGLHFNPVKKVCDWPTSAGCKEDGGGQSENVCYNHPHGDRIPYKGDCTKFWVCEYFEGTMVQCPSGLYFNPVLKVCDWPTSAGCEEEGGGPIESPTTPSTESPTTPSTESPSTEEPTTPSTESPTTPSTESPTTPSTEEPTTPSTEAPESPTTTETIPTLMPDDNICVNKENGALFPYPYDCNWYIRCEECSPIVLLCPDGKQFNAALLICDYPENVQCLAKPYPTTITDITTESTIEPSTESPTTPSTEMPTTPLTEEPTTPSTETPITPSTESQTTTETIPTLMPDENICVDKENGALFPYPYDCEWYIRCEECSPIVLLCPEGKKFNAALHICDYPENVQCVAKPYPTTTTEAVTESTTESVSTDPSTIQTTTTFDPIPTLEPDFDSCIHQPNNTLLAYPWDCAWYIRCDDENAFLELCKDGRVFNPVLRICDFPENTECKVDPYPSTETSTEITIETSPSTTTQEPSSESTNPPYIGTGICAHLERGTLLAYPGRCDLYIICIEPAPTAISCPSGLEFNPKAEKCQEPEEADCSIPNITTGSTTTTEVTYPPIYSGICSDHPNDKLIPYPQNCSQYIKCEWPIPTAEECPKDLEFNEILEICESAKDAGCSCSSGPTPVTPEAPTTPSEPTNGTGVCKNLENGDKVAYPGDCTKFITCEQPIPTAHKCDYDLVFNDFLGICDDPSSFECEPLTPPPHTESPTDPSMTGICKGHQQGDRITYPDSCNKYIVCLTPVSVAGTCKEELMFNEDLAICDTADSVDCSDYIPTPTPGEGITESPTQTPPTQPSPPSTGICQDQQPGDLIPYPGNCKKFIKCETDISYSYTCEEDLHFNAKLSICDDPETAECEPVISTPEPPVSGSNVCCGAQNGTLVPYPNDCTQYIKCFYPIPIAIECGKNLHYNTISQECEPIEKAGCEWYRPVTCENKDDGTLLPYNQNCKKYYYCSNGEKVLLPCTIGSIFNPSISKCVPGNECP